MPEIFETMTESAAVLFAEREIDDTAMYDYDDAYGYDA